MDSWGKIIEAVKKPIGLATLSLLIVWSIIITTINFYSLPNFTVLILIFSILFYTFFIIYLLIAQENEKELIKTQCIDEKINIEDDIKIYDNIQSSYEEMNNLINTSLKTGKETRIIVLGLALHHMWQYLKNFITLPTTERMKIELFLVDSASPVIQSLNNGWNDLSNDYIKIINNFLDIEKEYLNMRNIEISIHKYCHLPMFHGILINDEHLFLSYTSWSKKDILEGASNNYVHYTSDSSVGKYYIKTFLNWTNHIKVSNCEEKCYGFLNTHK